jgi:diguanylate cyclase (GGDEF)-like protein
LTKLKNRESLARDLKEHTFSGLLVVDIDEFHNYNDLYGMPTGNQILKEMAHFLQEFAKKYSYEVYRIYGDHFVLRKISDQISYHSLEIDIELLFSQIENYTIKIDIIDDKLELDITVGISLEEDKALKKAEMALLYAKKYKMQYIAYSKIIDSSEESQELLVWRNEIRKALQSNNIIPLFQPIVNRKQEVVKYEALMRLRRVVDGKEELISPFFFLEIAFKSKQYEKLTQVMIKESFKVACKSDCDISINLTFEDVVNKKITALLKSQIEEYKIGSKLIFEIVESSNIEDFTQVKRFISEFRQLGVRFAIDDFGSGYSNFTHIFELAPDFLKIDGSLIKNIDKDRKSYLLVRAIVKLAKHLQIETVAEFVSKKEIYDICYKLGVNYFQGYYFSAPLKEEQLLPYKYSYQQTEELLESA